MTAEIHKAATLAEITKLKEQLEENKVKLSKSGFDDGVMSCYQTLQGAVGQERSGLISHIVSKTACAIDSQTNEITPKSTQVALESLDAQKPRDAIEAKLISQAAALYSTGMDCLAQASRTERMDFMNVYGNLAAKYMRLHNETIEALGRYRRGGEQKVIVVHVANKMAVMNNYGGGGVHEKQGDTPCSL
jgi:hypothetical protein